MKWIVTISTAAFLAVAATIDGSGQFLSLHGPGVTLDESFNVDVGWYLVAAEKTYGLAALSPESQREIFGLEGYNPDHPPLGRLLLGVADSLGSAILSPDMAEGTRWSISAARFGAAVPYAVTVWLVGWFTLRITNGRVLPAAAASLQFAVIPRVFGHAHLASLESAIGLAFAACVLVLADRWRQEPTIGGGVLGGLLWGLALLTKIQAVLIPIPLTCWAIWYYRQKALVPLATVAVVGLATFFIGWPWLWLDPVKHFAEYFGRGTDRLALNVFFAGAQATDRDVSIFYTPAMFAVCVPLVLHVFASVGLVSLFRRTTLETRRPWSLVVGTVVFTLLFFTLPNISIYDGVRLFLVVFPLWACVAGVGAGRIWEWLSQAQPATKWLEANRTIAGACAIVLSFASLAFSQPHWLSHYSILVGWTRGAIELGFEANYWGDSLTEQFWDDVCEAVPEGSVVAVTPVLHQFQLATLEEQIPAIRNHGLQLIPWHGGDGNWHGGNGNGAKDSSRNPLGSRQHPERVVDPGYLIAFRRRSDLPIAVDAMFDRTDSWTASHQTLLGTALAIMVAVDDIRSADNADAVQPVPGETDDALLPATNERKP